MDTKLQAIQHFVVLMFENRSFDHMLGYLTHPAIEGVAGKSLSNVPNPNAPSTPVSVSRATAFDMPFDPGHEFHDIQIQLYGPAPGNLANPNPAVVPAPMSGFLASALNAAGGVGSASRVMQCFQPDQMPVLSTLAQEFAVVNFWHASLPGPTWPNRFFVHAATSGGLIASPSTAQMLAGFRFPNGTIYDRLGKDRWCIYHDGLPQSAGLDALRGEFLNPLTVHFRDLDDFASDVASHALPTYSFLEPRYDTGHSYRDGNSMHPLNDVRKGEALLKTIYETLRASDLWAETMLIVSFDEHGGFYDHVAPPSTTPPGGDQSYAPTSHPFDFARLGVRVPAIVVSPYTERGTVIGTAGAVPPLVFDHTSILATLEKRFNLAPLTDRDRAATTLEAALNRSTPRLSPQEALLQLPQPKTDSLWTRLVRAIRPAAAATKKSAPLTANQQAFVDLAASCDLPISDTAQHQAIRVRHTSIATQGDADRYIREVEDKIRRRRQPTVRR